ncbi:MAG TPA: decaprenyl-phosphate phosphoribosyltransferase [Candidatus Nanopelagicales bacterium]|jgi:decaprenyl-phosphate phosphoribosyltransferase
MASGPVTERPGAPGAHAEAAPSIVTVVRAHVASLRPQQWVKNILVAAAPLASGQLLSSPNLSRTAITFVVFCLASSATYLVNDVSDVATDRLHPMKRYRPVAAGTVLPATALVGSVVLAGVALVLSWTLISPQLAGVVALYLAINAAYSWGLKNQAVFDLAAVSAGFLLRAIAGGVATSVPLSQWFLLVAAFGSLFMVAGKRFADLHGGTPQDPRAPARVSYSATYLRFVWGMAGAATIVFYALWSVGVGHHHQVWAQISVAPFVFALMRYAMDVDRGVTGAPEEVVLRDRGLQLLGLLWLITFVVAAGAS